MRADESHQEGSKDGVNSNDARKEGGGEDQKDCQSHDRLSRAVVEATGTFQDDHEQRSDCIDEKEDPGDAGKQNVERRDAGTGVDQSYAER